jgi:hypothetical protein
VAYIPLNDPMSLVDGADSLAKVNLYRRGVNMPEARSASEADPSEYCANLRAIHPARLAEDKPFFVVKPSPFPLQADSLFTFMAMRYVTTYSELGCESLLKKPVNVTLTTSAAGVVTGAAFAR